MIDFNPFSTNVPLLYTLKTSENRMFSDIFRRYRSGTLVGKGLKAHSQVWDNLLQLRSLSKMMKNTFYFTSKTLFGLKLFLSRLFSYVVKCLDLKDKVNLKIYGFTTCKTNNCNTHIAHYFKKYRQSDNQIWSFNKINVFFL